MKVSLGVLSRPQLRGNLTDQQFNLLADVPPTMTWYSNIDNPQTRRAYQRDLQEFMVFTGIDRPEQFRAYSGQRDR